MAKMLTQEDEKDGSKRAESTGPSHGQQVQGTVAFLGGNLHFRVREENPPRRRIMPRKPHTLVRQTTFPPELTARKADGRARLHHRDGRPQRKQMDQEP